MLGKQPIEAGVLHLLGVRGSHKKLHSATCPIIKARPPTQTVPKHGQLVGARAEGELVLAGKTSDHGVGYTRLLRYGQAAKSEDGLLLLGKSAVILEDILKGCVRVECNRHRCLRWIAVLDTEKNELVVRAQTRVGLR